MSAFCGCIQEAFTMSLGEKLLLLSVSCTVSVGDWHTFDV